MDLEYLKIIMGILISLAGILAVIGVLLAVTVCFWAFNFFIGNII